MLTVAIAKGAAPREKPYKIADEKGLYLYVAPTGLKSLRMKYRFGGKEKLLVLGTFPELGLGDARNLRDDARQQIRNNVDPAAARRRTVEGKTFEEFARDWHRRKAPSWSAAHARDVLGSLERDVFPAIGAMPIGAIETPEIHALVQAIEERGAVETAGRVLQRISLVFARAIGMGAAKADPAGVVRKALEGQRTKRKQPARTKLDQARLVLAATERAAGGRHVKAASMLLALTAVRPGVVRGAAWTEMEDLDGPEPIWRVPAARMKLTVARKGDSENEHVVPLSRQAVQLLLELRGAAGADALLFPGRRRGQPIGKNAIADLYRRAGHSGRHVPHGWRAAFSTIMNERHRGDRGAIDLALAHTPKDKVEAAYNRAEHLGRRRELFQEWADLLTSKIA